MLLKETKETNVFVIIPNIVYHQPILVEYGNGNKFHRTVSELIDYDIKEVNLFDWIMDSLDETTSPRGVQGRIHIRETEGSIYRLNNSDIFISENEYDNLLESELTFYEYCGESTIGWELWTWGVNGNNPKFIISFDNEEDAEQAWFETVLWDFNNDDQRDTCYFETYEEALFELAEIWRKPIDCVRSYLKHKEIVENIKNQREVKKREEYNKRKASSELMIREEANAIIVDEVFKEDVKNVYTNLLQGENKSKGLSIAFNDLLKRNNIEKIKSDYWQVFRILNSKI